ncbi:hypothetical protein GCM10025876_41490 [Demequina litorisediminis]|uniref:Uncharacterized protein n=1 Tax=Demequina litorisediminis TaxID=1849022 RepID=A0ABQ6IL27_9MICO|nr:hypothetical protein GCM10025876_39950 [Demequina litorisediminis]GMA37851.1 hypothetical protein GCM10025876_40550 [Demequina litorisediminis]GMA37888.1 hypothetical protein GCM10025876_40920 [Demequina litorisediminis]GMA37945.1 hypothetical protein GCM10025876_41490 [Demequina litorisediminis]
MAAISVMAGILVGMTGTAATAAVVYGAWETVWNVGAYDYKARPSANSNGTKPSGGLTVSSSPTAPAGWQGASARLWRGNALCGSASRVLTTQSVTIISRTVAKDCGSGEYRGSGFGYAYYSGDYRSHQSARSPIVIW